MNTILLINTNIDKVASSRSIFPPMGLLAIAGALKKHNYKVKLIDPQIDDDYMRLIEEEIKKKPSLIGMSTFIGKNILHAERISKKIKEMDKDIPIVWGGPLATSSPEICLDKKQGDTVDYIVMGMGEETIVRLVKALEDNKDISQLENVSTKLNSKPLIKPVYYCHTDLDDMPLPDLTLWEEGVRKRGSIPIVSSRGCPRNCAFCYNNAFIGKKKWFSRSAENVIGEMLLWKKHFNMDSFYFIDDNFLVDTKRAKEILIQSIKNNFKITQVNGHVDDFKPEILQLIHGYVNQVGFAIESASPKIQKILNKHIDLNKALSIIKHFTEQGIKNITTNFMFGIPTETDDDVKVNVDMAVKIHKINKNVRIVAYLYTPQPKDNIIPQFENCKDLKFDFEKLTHFDLCTNRTNFISLKLRPWMNEDDLPFYLDLVKTWFYYFDPLVRKTQPIDLESTFKRHPRIAKLFKDVPLPEEVK